MMTGDVWGLPRADWVILAGVLLVAAWAVRYYRSHPAPVRETMMAEHQWVPYTGILTRLTEGELELVAELGPHPRTCTVCGVITDDVDDCADLACTPGRHR